MLTKKVITEIGRDRLFIKLRVCVVKKMLIAIQYIKKLKKSNTDFP